MDLDDTFYQQWKAQKTNNRYLFTEKPGNNKIFSSTTVEDQTATESFSLRLSESYEVDETQESLEKNKQKKIEEIVLISDSSSEDGSLIKQPGPRINPPNTVIKKSQNRACIIESSDDELPSSQVQGILQEAATKERLGKRNVIIEESDSELEQSKLPEIIKETIAESVTLSDRKKKEILQWLSNNFDGSRCGSSCSTESAIADSRKSGVSSGNSSLERLELNFETPNNRGKLSKPGKVRQQKCTTESENQTRIDQYFPNTRKGQLQITRDATPKSKNFDQTPVKNLKNVILSSKESWSDDTPNGKSPDRTPVNSVNRRRNVLPEHRSASKTPMVNKSSDKNISSTKCKMNKNSIISESSKSDDSGGLSGSSVKLNKRNIIIPETQSFESDDGENMIDSPKTRNCKNSEIKQLSQESDLVSDVNVLKTSDEDIFQSTSESKCKELQNSDQNNTINDCADILENLYGTTWRNKIITHVAVTEPRKKATKTVLKKVQTDKKCINKQPTLNGSSGKEISDKENNHVTNGRNVATNNVKKSHKLEDSFINDGASTESSPDCSYYTALTNPVPSQNNIPKTLPIMRNKSDHQKKLIELCDSDSDLDDANWNHRDLNQRKLSFDSSSSSTSEFDPEDVVPPKNTRVKKPTNVESVKQKKTVHTEKEPTRKSFLASLSKDVPLDHADFKAMVYRVKYNSLKEELCKVLYKLFNEKVFDNKLPEDMSIEWSVRLRGTAGKCYNKQSIKALGKTVRSSRIVLATKILDSPDRLRDTLIHEMCHAATWLINNVSDGHGSFWKAWASKAMKAFPELPSISRCHNYEIQTKYTYKCTGCGYSIGRHSKSLDLNRKRCGYCHGSFELLINKVTKAGTVQKKSTAQTKEPSGFALYVKENYHVVKQSGASMKHAEVMKILGQQFSAVKITPKPADRIRNNEDESP